MTDPSVSGTLLMKIYQTIISQNIRMQIHRQTNENKAPSLVTYNNDLKMDYRLPSPEDLASWYRPKTESFPSSFLLLLLDISCNPYPFFCDVLLSPRTALYQDSQLLYLAETQANNPFPSLHSLHVSQDLHYDSLRSLYFIPSSHSICIFLSVASECKPRIQGLSSWAVRCPCQIFLLAHLHYFVLPRVSQNYSLPEIQHPPHLARIQSG